MDHDVSVETRMKISAALKGRKLTAKHRAALSAAQIGRKPSVETCMKLSAASTGRKHNAETRAKIGAAHKGRKLSAEHRAKLMGRQLSAEHRATLSTVRKGRKLSAEHRAAISKGLTRIYTGSLGLAHRKKLAEATARALANGLISRIQTKPERIMLLFLHNAGFHVLAQRAFGKYCVDAYLPKEHLAFEADGDYWHSLPKVKQRDVVRDAYLEREFNLPVTRLSERELRDIEKEKV